MKEKEIRAFCINLMEETKPVYFTTVDKGIPYTRAVENLRNKAQFPSLTKVFTNHGHDLLVYISTNSSSVKVDQVKKNPNVSLYYCEPEDYHGVMIGGKIEIVKKPKIKENLWCDGWEVYYPEGVKDQDYTVLCLLPKHIRGWNCNKNFTLDLI